MARRSSPSRTSGWNSLSSGSWGEAYFFVGAGNDEKGITAPHHHPRFDIDEDSLEIGTKLFVHAALGLLDAEPGGV